MKHYTGPEVLFDASTYRYDADDLLVFSDWYFSDGGGGGGIPTLQTPAAKHHVYSGGQRVLSVDDLSGLVEDRYTWGPGVDQLLADEAFDSFDTGELIDTYWAATDHLGTVGQLLDGAGEVVEHREYSSFGELDAIYDELGDAKLSLFSQAGFTGKLHDLKTGLVDSRARWYDPHAGRFVGEDPAGFADGPNPFQYAGNDPINFRDPTGLSQAGNPLNGLFNSTLGGSALVGPQYRAPASNYSRDIASPLGPVRPLQTSDPTILPVAYPVQTAQAPRSQTSGNPSSPQLIRNITADAPIVPREVRDLPGVKQALENPNRYLVTNHSNQGNFVVDLEQGSVKFVTGEEYLPIQERQRRADIDRAKAANRAQGLTLLQEGLVTVSPIHETGRDASVLLTGKDYLVDPSIHYTTQDRLNAGVFLLLPDINSGQTRYLDEALGRLPRNQADAIAQDLFEQPGIRRIESLPGSRPGSLGHLDHQTKVLQLEQQALFEAAPGEKVFVQRKIQNPVRKEFQTCKSLILQVELGRFLKPSVHRTVNEICSAKRSIDV